MCGQLNCSFQYLAYLLLGQDLDDSQVVLVRGGGGVVDGDEGAAGRGGCGLALDPVGVAGGRQVLVTEGLVGADGAGGGPGPVGAHGPDPGAGARGGEAGCGSAAGCAGAGGGTEGGVGVLEARDGHA